MAHVDGRDPGVAPHRARVDPGHLLRSVLSFTEWDNLAPDLGGIRFVGFRNYWQIFTIFDNRLFPALFNNLILIVWLFLCSAVGILFAYLLDKNVRGSRDLPEHLLLPGRAVARGRRLHLEERDVLAATRGC